MMIARVDQAARGEMLTPVVALESLLAEKLETQLLKAVLVTNESDSGNSLSSSLW